MSTPTVLIKIILLAGAYGLTPAQVQDTAVSIRRDFARAGFSVRIPKRIYVRKAKGVPTLSTLRRYAADVRYRTLLDSPTDSAYGGEVRKVVFVPPAQDGDVRYTWGYTPTGCYFRDVAVVGAQPVRSSGESGMLQAHIAASHELAHSMNAGHVNTYPNMMNVGALSQASESLPWAPSSIRAMRFCIHRYG